MNNLTFALRQLRKSPGFTLVAVLTLALGIGVNSAVFALINGVVLRSPIPLRPDEVVNVFTVRQNASQDYRQFSHAEYRELRENGGDLFADVAASEFGFAGIGDDQNMRRTLVFLTSENFFSLMGVRPVIGRFYNAEECQPNANVPVAVASYAFWKRMGGRQDFIGSKLRINGRPYSVIGITPDGFSGAHALLAPDVWLPLGAYSQLRSGFDESESLHDLAQPKNYALNLTARLQPGLNIDAAKSRLPVVGKRLTAIQPSDTKGARELQIQTPSRVNLSDTPQDEGPVALIGTLLMAMAGAVLIIACLNLANMLLARGATRAKEIAVRLALGASRWRIVRQLLCEGLLLAICGGLVGLIISVWCNDLLLHSLARLFSSMSFSLVANLHPEATVLAVTFLFCALATMLFSLGPALKASKVDLVHDLKQQVGEPTRTRRFNRFFAPRHISVMAQIALSLMLLFSAGLFFRGALKASGLNPGFESAGDLVTEFDFSLVKKDPAQARRLMFAAVRRARDLPGVRTAALGTMLPYGNITESRRIMSVRETMPIDSKTPDPGADALYTATTPGYFDAIGVKLLRGRDFTQAEAENKDTPRVAIIDDEMAKKLFPSSDAIGQQIRYTQPPNDGSPDDMEVVGVVSSHRQKLPLRTDTLNRRLFVPLAQGYRGNVFLHIGFATRDRRALIGQISTLRQMLRGVDPDLPTLSIAPFSDEVEKNFSLWFVRLGAILFSVFGGIALLLAVVGVYGVKAYAVACRTREIGIRMALGAHRRDVFALIMRQGALQTALAVVVGLLLSLVAGRVLAKILYEVSPSDPFALVAASVILVAAALIACFLPARRATHVDPIEALRAE